MWHQVLLLGPLQWDRLESFWLAGSETCSNSRDEECDIVAGDLQQTCCYRKWMEMRVWELKASCRIRQPRRSCANWLHGSFSIYVIVFIHILLPGKFASRLQRCALLLPPGVMCRSSSHICVLPGVCQEFAIWGATCWKHSPSCRHVMVLIWSYLIDSKKMELASPSLNFDEIRCLIKFLKHVFPGTQKRQQLAASPMGALRTGQTISISGTASPKLLQMWGRRRDRQVQPQHEGRSSLMHDWRDSDVSGWWQLWLASAIGAATWSESVWSIGWFQMSRLLEIWSESKPPRSGKSSLNLYFDLFSILLLAFDLICPALSFVQALSVRKSKQLHLGSWYNDWLHRWSNVV